MRSKNVKPRRTFRDGHLEVLDRRFEIRVEGVLRKKGVSRGGTGVELGPNTYDIYHASFLLPVRALNRASRPALPRAFLPI
jgi:hypothetical protein